MAAGLGFKTFTTGEVLTAGDVNGYLMQGINVFASAAARDAAITSPQEGQACYLKDTNSVLTYSGSAWVAVGGGSPLTTKGDLYGYSTTDARVPIGTNGQVLQADSAQALGLKWATPSSSAVVQVKSFTTSSSTTVNSTTFTSTGLTLSITPTSASNKILIFGQMAIYYYVDSGNYQGAGLRIVRDATNVYSSEPGEASSFDNFKREAAGNMFLGLPLAYSYLDSPATTSATTYTLQTCRQAGAGTVLANYHNPGSITLMEVTP